MFKQNRLFLFPMRQASLQMFSDLDQYVPQIDARLPFFPPVYVSYPIVWPRKQSTNAGEVW